MSALQVIYKYWAAVGEHTRIPWGTGTRCTAAEADAGGLTFWCVHVGQIPIKLRTVAVIGTGHPFPSTMDVLATSRHSETQLVWHLIGEPVPAPEVALTAGGDA